MNEKCPQYKELHKDSINSDKNENESPDKGSTSSEEDVTEPVEGLPEKRKIMVVGSEKVGKQSLVEELYKNAEDSLNNSPEKSPDIQLMKQNSVMQGKSLDFLVKKLFNQNKNKMETFHIWIQNLSVEKHMEIVECKPIIPKKIIIFCLKK